MTTTNDTINDAILSAIWTRSANAAPSQHDFSDQYQHRPVVALDVVCCSGGARCVCAFLRDVRTLWLHDVGTGRFEDRSETVEYSICNHVIVKCVSRSRFASVCVDLLRM